MSKKVKTCSSNGASPATLSDPTLRTRLDPNSTALRAAIPAAYRGFKYTKDYTDPGLVWNKETFQKYIKNPRAMMPDTTMIFAGTDNEQESNNLWAYISRYNADGSLKKK